MLLGVASLRAGGKIHYDAANMKVTTPSSANAFLSREYPQGWNVRLCSNGRLAPLEPVEAGARTPANPRCPR